MSGLRESCFTPGQDVLIEAKGQGGQVRAKCMCKIVGALAPRFFLVHLPPLPDGTLIIEPADRYCIVRFLHEGEAIGFRALIVEVFDKPLPLAILRYPEEYEKVTVREAERISCNITARLKPPRASAFAARDRMSKTGGTDADSPPHLLHSWDLAGEYLDVSMIDLSKGGGQFALPVIDPENRDAKNESPLKRSIPANRYGDYHPDGLAKIFKQGNTLLLDFEIPGELRASFQNIGFIVCWTKMVEHTMLVGVRFTDISEKAADTIERLIQRHQTYFRKPAFLR